MQVPLPEGVEHLLLVQHLMSEEPGQRLEVVVPEQQPAEILTQTPSMPKTAIQCKSIIQIRGIFKYKVKILIISYINRRKDKFK